jgi:hypothetical protein
MGMARAEDGPSATGAVPAANAEQSTGGAPPAAQTHHIEGTGEQKLMFRITSPASAGFDTFMLELTRLGEEQTIRLSDDGSNPEDLAYDGVFSGAHTGHYARVVSVRVLGSAPDGTHSLLYSGVERTDDVHEVIVGWRVIRRDQDFVAVRAPAAYPGNITEVHLGLPLLVGFGWGGIVLIYIGFLFQRRRQQ